MKNTPKAKSPKKSALKTKVQKASYKAGDSIEKAGRRLQSKGYKKLGSRVERAGDKIEHMAD